MIDVTVVSRRQQEVLDALAELRTHHDYPPTVREIADELGIQVSTAHAHLLQLRRHGLVEWRPGRPRTLRIL